MKLKLVVASMSVLGLVSCPLLAAATTSQHHKHMAKKHAMESQENYKDMGALPSVVCPINTPASAIMDLMSQNVGRAKPTEDCMKLISFAGGANIDAHWGNLNYGYNGENTQKLSFNDAYLNVFGNVNDWTKAFLSLSYNTTSTDNLNSKKASLYAVSGLQTSGSYSDAYQANTFTVEQGYVTFSNFNEMPVFVQLGKQFQPFGQYKIHPIQETLPQVLSESLQTSAEIGFLTRMGIHGALYVFDNSLPTRASLTATTAAGHTQPNYGAELGYSHPDAQLGYNVGIGYMYNFTGVNSVADGVGDYHVAATGTFTTTESFYNRVGALAVYANINSGPFTLGGHYVTALSHFDTYDLSRQTVLLVPAASANGAQPWAADLQAGYGFNYWNKDQNIYLGYQASGEAVNLFLPESRWLVGYGVTMWKNTDLGLEIAHDTDYGSKYGATGNSSNTIGFRVGVTFG